MTLLDSTTAPPPLPPPLDQPPDLNGRQEKLVKSRRAFAACKLCRNRKTKCVPIPRQKSCQQCLLYGEQCVMAIRGRGRKKLNPDAEQIDRRIEALEFWISRSQPKTAVPLYPAETARPSSENANTGLFRSSFANDSSASDMLEVCRSPPESGAAYSSSPQPGQMIPESINTCHFQSSFVNSSSATSTLKFHDRIKSIQPSPRDRDIFANRGESNIQLASPVRVPDLLCRLLSRLGYYNDDAGRSGYSDPLASLSKFENLNSGHDQGFFCAEEREASSIIGSLSARTHAEILAMYWKNYNTITEVVPKEIFLQGHHTDDRDLYSTFLHSAILAIGIRFANKESADIVKLMVSPYESIFHSLCKQMVIKDMEKGSGIPSIQALLLLSDLEYGCGRDRMCWMYAGMASRLFFDLGLHTDSTSIGLTNLEAELRQKVASACIISDKCWSFFFARPTTIKHSDLHHSHKMSTAGKAPLHYRAATALMNIAGKGSDIYAMSASEADLESHAMMGILYGELERWYKGLHPSLVWNSENAQTGFPAFFLLHQQYHAIRIMLHRPFIDRTGVPERRDSNFESSASLTSELICVESAQQMAEIFEFSNDRMKMRQSHITAPQQAVIGIIVLIEVARRKEFSEEHNELTRHIHALKSVLQELGHTYEYASRMHCTISIALNEWPSTKQPEMKPSNSPAEETNDAHNLTKSSPSVSGEDNEGDVQNWDTEDIFTLNLTEDGAGYGSESRSNSNFLIDQPVFTQAGVARCQEYRSEPEQSLSGADMFMWGLDVDDTALDLLQQS